MRARIGATRDIAGEPKDLRLEIFPDDMPVKVLCIILRKIGYECRVGAVTDHLQGGVVIVPHRAVGEAEEDGAWARGGS